MIENMLSLDDLISSIVTALLAIPVSVLTTLIMGYAKRPQVVYEQKAAIIGEIAKGRIEHLQGLRRLLLRAEGLENLVFLESNNIGDNSYNNEQVTLHILLNREITATAMLELNDALSAASDALGIRSRANLMCFMHFLNELVCRSVGEGIAEEKYVMVCSKNREMIKKLIRQCDGYLVNELNSIRTKFIKRNGLIWSIYLQLANHKYQKSLDKLQQEFKS